MESRGKTISRRVANVGKAIPAKGNDFLVVRHARALLTFQGRNDELPRLRQSDENAWFNFQLGLSPT
jgi:hypothetical protein